MPCRCVCGLLYFFFAFGRPSPFGTLPLRCTASILRKEVTRAPSSSFRCSAAVLVGQSCPRIICLDLPPPPSFSLSLFSLCQQQQQPVPTIFCVNLRPPIFHPSAPLPFRPSTLPPFLSVHPAVTLEEEEPHSTYIMRSFKLVAGKASTTVVHFQYTVWPDHGVPNTTSEILGFRKAVRKAVPAYGPPLLVHCSAGVGRTGSFCVVDTMLSRGDVMDRDFSVEKLVREFRSDRNYMVQTLIQYQFCFRAVLDGLHKSIARTVRAIKKKSASVIEDAALQLDELQGDIADALDVYVGSEKDEAAFLTLGRKAGRGIKPDVRWSEFDAESDKQVATAVPKAVREESLTMAQDLWRVRGNVPMAPDEHGYLEGQAAPLEKRVESLALHASPEAWKTRYAAVSSEWVAEVYDVGASLNPIESRLMSLASQNESWKLRGQHYRDSLVAEQRAIKVTYDARMNSLETVVVGSEDRWRDRGDGMRGKKAETNGIVEHTADTFGSYEQRISRLSTFASSSGARGTTDGREVESPVKKKKAAAEIRARLDAERLEESQRLEQIRLTKMREERRAREAEAAHNAEKPIQGAGRHLLNKTPKQLVTLRETARPKAVHPMVAQASAKAGKGKKKK